MSDVNSFINWAVFGLVLGCLLTAPQLVGFGMNWVRATLGVAWLIGVVGGCASMTNAPWRHLGITLFAIGVPLGILFFGYERLIAWQHRKHQKRDAQTKPHGDVQSRDQTAEETDYGLTITFRRQKLTMKDDPDDRRPGSVTSHNQSGGITAYNVNLDIPPPKISAAPQALNEPVNGMFRHRVIVTIDSKVPLINFCVRAIAPSVVSIEANSRFSAVTITGTTSIDEKGAMTCIPNANGAYDIVVVTLHSESLIMEYDYA